MKRSLIFISSLLFSLFLTGTVLRAQDYRWRPEGTSAISWKPGSDIPHSDHIEMSGRQISAVLRYGVDDGGSFQLLRDIVWPLLRTIPNNTHASLIRSFSFDPLTVISVNRKPIKGESVTEIILDGTLTVKSTFGNTLAVVRTIFPSPALPLLGERYVLRNTGARELAVEIPGTEIATVTDPAAGTEGSYRLTVRTTGSGAYIIHPGDSVVFYLTFTGEKNDEDFRGVNPSRELHQRRDLVSELMKELVVETPDEVLDRAFAFAKIRAAESIFATRGGPMHGPGGLSYYAAIWANDQAEYINPFFPTLGYSYGIESAINAYRHFARFMNSSYDPLPSSIIAEGTDIWNGAGDRGDAAMIAYGASRFALMLGDRNVAEELWPLIEWCLEYNRRKLNHEGVVTSDSDELEGRFPSGEANLCTSSLYYDALLSASFLTESTGKGKKTATHYRLQAEQLRKNIDKYFGYNVMGYDTYRYYEGNEILRAWICIPLTAGIYERKQGTIDALFSPDLWTEDGLASVSGDKTFWDRATLYALRGVFAAGETRRGLEYLRYYSGRRLLGEHVPYPVEAYPEGGQRHLSAESGLYCRIFTEGIFGLRPTGLTGFTLTPRLPAEWDYMNLRRVHGFGALFDIEITREGDSVRVKVISGGVTIADRKVKNGSQVNVMF